MRLQNYSRLVTSRPWLTLTAALALALALGAGCGQLEFRSDNRIFFSAENPELLALDQFEAVFGRDDTLVFVVSAPQGDLFTPARLAAIGDLTTRAWRMPHVQRVDSVTNFQRVAATDDTVVIDHLARQGDTLTAADARQLRAVALAEPLLVKRLLSQDAKTGLVAVKFRLSPAAASSATGSLVAEARDMANSFRQDHGDLELRLTGSLALDNAFGEAAAWDGAVLIPAMIILILALLGWLLHSWAAVLCATLVIAASVAAALGAAGYLGIPLSSPSVVAPNIILVLATADCIHLAAAAGRCLRANGDRVAAVREGLVSTFRPITLTSLTTAVGFFSLSFSESPPFQHLGWIAGMGVVLAWVFSVTIMPAVLVLLVWRAPAKTLPVERLCAAIGDAVTARPVPVIACTLSVAVVLSGFAFANELDDRYVRYFDERFEFRRDTDFFNRELGGFYTLEYRLRTPATEGVNNPAYLRQVDDFANWLRTQHGVTHVQSLADVMKTINRAMHGGAASTYELPKKRDVAAQYMMLYEMSLPVGLDLKQSVSADKAQSRMTVSLTDLSTSETLALAERAHTWAADNAPLIAGSTQATGTSVLFSHVGMRNIEQMLLGTLIALTLISAILFAAFRSAVLGAVGVITNATPALVALGGWALVVGEVGMAVATIAAITLGIVVDDTIHFIAAAQRARRNGTVDARQAVRRAFVEAGPGMITTTIALAVGFGCLSLSGFQINAWMGLMTAIVICVALVFDFLFLPAVLVQFTRWT